MNKEFIKKELELHLKEPISFIEDIMGRELILINGKGLPLDEYKNEKELVNYILDIKGNVNRSGAV